MILIRRFDFGGSENHVRELANSLYSMGNKVLVVSEKGRQRQLLALEVRYRWAFLSKWLLPINLIYLLILAKQFKAEVIHAHQSSAILTSALLCKMLGIPLVVTVHATTGLELRSKFTRETPSRIIYVNRHTMERSDWYASLRSKCRYIPNGIQRHGNLAEGNGRRLVYCSRLDKTHGRLLKLPIEEVMPSLKVQFPNLVFEIVGDGSMVRQIETWAEKADNLLGAGSIVLTGYKEKFIDGTHEGCLVIGVGRVALEALSWGAPVLAVNGQRLGPRISSANYETLRQTNFVDVTARKPSITSLVESISEVYNHYDAAVEESRLLQERVKHDFALSTMVEKILQVYAETIGKSRS
jgi:glycosyltransferase involved in cell wall biosynthesis